MRVLWFTNTPSRYASFGGYNGGGWIYSLEEEMSKREDIDLGIAFFMNGQKKKVHKNGVTYYPIEDPFTSSNINKLKGKFISQKGKEKEWLNRFQHVIEDFVPDVIEVFGSEQSFGQVAEYTKVPVVLHIQGILTPCYNAFLPPFISKHNYIWEDCNPFHAFKRFRGLRSFYKNGVRELNMVQHISYFIGRTEWDKRLTHLFNPKAKYFYGSEILRDVFYAPVERHIPPKAMIISTLSSPLYKGYETVLKTAKLLKELSCIDFDWRIYGNIDPKFVERRLRIYHDDVNVRFMGVASSEELKNELSSATAYVHLSYIDNSPNSVCEAQITGIPVIATNVGGIPSLIQDGETGFLVPANDPYQTAYLIHELSENKDMNNNVGKRAREVALKRHDKNVIVNSLINSYKDIINEKSEIK